MNGNEENMDIMRININGETDTNSTQLTATVNDHMEDSNDSIQTPSHQSLSITSLDTMFSNSQKNIFELKPLQDSIEPKYISLVSHREGYLKPVNLKLQVAQERRQSCLFGRFSGMCSKFQTFFENFNGCVLYLEILRYLYYIVSIPLRMGLFFDPTLYMKPYNTKMSIWDAPLTIFTCLDVIADGIGVCLTLQRLLRIRMKHLDNDNRMPTQKLPTTKQANKVFNCTERNSMQTQCSLTKRNSQVNSLRLKTSDQQDQIHNRKINFQHFYTSWFWECIILMPIEIVPIVMQTYNVLHIARILKLAILRDTYKLFIKFGSRWPKLYITQIFHQHVLVLLICRLLAYGILWIHISAMLYWLIANYECGVTFDRCTVGLSSAYGSWAIADQLRNATTTRKYLRSVYWATRTIITLGFKDVVATTVLETAYTIFAEAVGAFWCASVISAWAYYFVVEKAPEHAHDVFLHEVTNYLQDIGAPKYLKYQVIAYLEYEWKTTRQFNESQFLNILQRENLQSEFRSNIKTSRLLGISIFAEQSPGFVQALSVAMEFQIFAPLDWIIKSPELQERMFIVNTGFVAITQRKSRQIMASDVNFNHSTQDTIVDVGLYQLPGCAREGGKIYTCKPGDYFGAIALFEPHENISEESFAETFSTLLVLTKTGFEKVLHTYFAQSKELLQDTKESIEQAVKDNYTEFHRQISTLSFQLHSTSSVAPLITSCSRDALTYHEQQTQLLRQEKPWQHPKSKFRTKWKAYRAAFTCYLAIEVPYIVIFYYGNNGQFGEWGFNMTFILSVIVEIFFYIDFYYCCYNFYIPEAPEKLPELQTSMRIKDYYKANGLYIDLLANLPLAIIFDCVDGLGALGSKYNVLSLLRLLRFLRVRRLNKLVRETLHTLTGAMQFVVYCSISIFIYCHFVGCIWFIIGYLFSLSTQNYPIKAPPSIEQCLQMAQEYRNCSWTVMDGLHAQGVNEKFMYLRSLYFSISTFTTVAYGDIVPYSDLETIIAIFSIYIGGVLCYGVVGAMGSAITRLVAKSRATNDHENLVNRFLVKFNISDPLRVTIRQFHQFVDVSSSLCNTETIVLKMLSIGLRQSLARFIHENLVRTAAVIQLKTNEKLQQEDISLISSKESDAIHQIQLKEEIEYEGMMKSQRIQLFAHYTSNAFILAIASHMKRSIYYAHETIFFGNNIPTQLFILRSGVVHITNNETHESIGWSKSRDVLNEIEFFLQVAYPREAIAVRITELSMLSYHDFQLLEKCYPSDVNICKAMVKECYNTKKLVREYPKNMESVNVEISPDIATTQSIRKLEHDSIRSRSLSMFHTLYSSIKLLTPSLLTYEDSTKNLDRVTGDDHSELPPQQFDTFRSQWEVIMAFIIFYEFAIIVGRLAYLPDPSTRTMIILTIMDYATDIILLLDIYFQWNSFAPKKDITRKMTRAQIRAYYKQNWFYYDILASLPLYYIGSNFLVMTLCRLPRLIRVLQLGEFSNSITSMLARRYPSSISQSLLGLGNVCLLFILCCHIGGSVFFAIANSQPSRGWIGKDIVLSHTSKDDIYSSYIRAFYWAMSTFTVVNYGDIAPISFIETFWACIICLVGTFFMSNVGGEIVNIIHTFNRARSVHQLDLEEFHSLAHAKNLPIQIRDKATRYLHFQFNLCEGLDPQKIFADLPSGLKHRLYGELYCKYIEVLPIFSSLSSGQRDDLCSIFSLQLFLPNEIILYEHSAGESLCIMKVGRAEVIHLGISLAVGVVHEGQLFGEVAFFNTHVNRIATVRALAYCEVLLMKKSDWVKFATKSSNVVAAAHIVSFAKESMHQYARSNTNIAANLGYIEENGNYNLQTIEGSGKIKHNCISCGKEGYSGINSHNPKNSSIASATPYGKTNMSSTGCLSPHRGKLQKILPNIHHENELNHIVRRNNNMPSSHIMRKARYKVNSSITASPHIVNFSSNKLPTVNTLTKKKSQNIPRGSHNTMDNSHRHSISTLTSPKQLDSTSVVINCKKISCNHRSFSTPDLKIKQTRISKDNTDEAASYNAKSNVSPPQKAKHLPMNFQNRPQDSIKTQKYLNNTLFGINNLDIGVSIDIQHEKSFLTEGSQFRNWWDTVKGVATLYYCIAIPFRAAFYNIIMDGISKSIFDTWLVLESILDFFFWLDIYMHWFHFQPLSVYGEVIVDRPTCRDIYRKKGTFYVDIIANIPFEWLVYLPGIHQIFSSNLSQIAAIFRLEILIRFIHVGGLCKRVERYFFYEDNSTGSRQNVLAYIKMMAMCFLSSHWIACLWYYVGEATITSHNQSWLTAPFMLVPERVTSETIGSVPLLTKYLRAYHYAIGSISTVTFGDITCTNLSETRIQIPIVFLCIIFYGYITGSVRKVLERQLGSRIAYEQQIVRVKKYMMYHNLPNDFSLRVIKHIHEQCLTSGGSIQARALSNLNVQLRQDVLVMLRKALVQHQEHPFVGFTPFLIHAVMSALHEEIYDAREIIYEEHAPGKCMYFIEFGTVLLTTFDRTTSQFHVKKKAGNVFGANALLYATAREYTARAVTKCQLAVLHGHAYRRIAAMFPQHANVMINAWSAKRVGCVVNSSNCSTTIPWQDLQVDSSVPSSRDLFAGEDSTPTILLSPSRAFLLRQAHSHMNGNKPTHRRLNSKEDIFEVTAQHEVIVTTPTSHIGLVEKKV